MGILISALLVQVVQKQASPYRKLDFANLTTSLALATTANPPRRFPEDDVAITFCTRLETLPHTHILILFIWTSKLMAEFIDVLNRINTICAMPLTRRPGTRGSAEVNETP